MTFHPGDRVRRIENRPVTGATVFTVEDESIYITYDEGGEGTWPPECLELIDQPEHQIGGNLGERPAGDG